jgi:hypothetical protein
VPFGLLTKETAERELSGTTGAGDGHPRARPALVGRPGGLPLTGQQQDGISVPAEKKIEKKTLLRPVMYVVSARCKVARLLAALSERLVVL